MNTAVYIRVSTQEQRTDSRGLLDLWSDESADLLCWRYPNRMRIGANLSQGERRRAG